MVYTDVDRYGGGIVEFTTRDDQEEAIRRLDDTEFKSKLRRVINKRERGFGKASDRVEAKEHRP